MAYKNRLMTFQAQNTLLMVFYVMNNHRCCNSASEPQIPAKLPVFLVVLKIVYFAFKKKIGGSCEGYFIVYQVKVSNF